MPPTLSTLSAYLEQLAARRGLLLCLLLAANALVQPYAGFDHDARLYAAQVTERVAPGTLAADLYLRYGSQDRYTLFTPVLAPLVRLAGLPIAFYLVYLASKALLLWALQRLVLTLLDDRPAAVLSLLFLAIAPLPFGGNEVFHVNESFLTPRLAASALVLLALERLLAGRPALAVLLLAGSLLLHPLMAVAGLLVLLLAWVAGRLRGRQLAALAAAGVLLSALVVGCPPLGRRIFGYMDPQWRDINLDVCFFIRPACWSMADWLRSATSAAVVAMAGATFARQRAAFLGAVLAAALLGLVGSLVAVHSTYRLLIQASPYRTLWLLEVLAIPLGFAAAHRLWQHGCGPARCGALALLLALTADWNRTPFAPLLPYLALLPICAILYRGLASQPRRPDWLAASAVTSFLITFVLLCLTNVALLLALFRARPTPHLDIHPVVVLLAVGLVLFKLPLLLLLAAGTWLLRPAGSRRWTGIALLGFWAGYPALLTWVNSTPWYTERFSALQPHVRFVNDSLRHEAAGRSRPLMVYWPTDLRFVWFQAGVNSYYNWVQLSGCAFNRGTAVEGRRRALLVGVFERAAIRRMPPAEPWWREALLSFYQAVDTPPTEQDLFRLCAEPGLDYVVLEHRFEGWYSASAGTVYIYDCRRIRSLTHSACVKGAVGS